MTSRPVLLTERVPEQAPKLQQRNPISNKETNKKDVLAIIELSTLLLMKVWFLSILCFNLVFEIHNKLKSDYTSHMYWSCAVSSLCLNSLPTSFYSRKLHLSLGQKANMTMSISLLCCKNCVYLVSIKLTLFPRKQEQTGSWQLAFGT